MFLGKILYFHSISSPTKIIICVHAHDLGEGAGEKDIVRCDAHLGVGFICLAAYNRD